MVSHQIKYTLKTDNGSYLVEATDLPLPVSKVQRIWTWLYKVFNKVYRTAFILRFKRGGVD